MMPLSDGDVAVEIDDITSIHSSRRSRQSRDGGKPVRRRTRLASKQDASNYGAQTLNRRLGKLTKKMDATGGIVRVLDSHLKSVANNIGVDVEVYFKEVIWLFWIPVAGLILILLLLVTPQLFERFNELSGYENNGQFLWWEIFTGEGWMNKTELFQSFYTSKDTPYNMPMAYVLTISVAYFLYLIWIMKSLINNFSEKYVERDAKQKAKKKEKQDENAVSISSTPKIFTMWDFSIIKTATAKVRRNIIREEIDHFNRARTREELEAGRKQFFVNIAVNVVLYLLVAGLGVGIWFISFSVNWNPEGNNFVPILTSLCSFLFPVIFNVVGTFESYMKRSSALTVGMLRQLFLQLVLFVSFVFYLISVAKCASIFENDPFRIICSAKYPTPTSTRNATVDNSTTTSNATSQSSSTTCLEYEIGQQLYRWQVLDVGVMIFFSLLVYGGWKLLSVCGVCKAPIVDVPQLMQHLMLAQSLNWFAMFFVPLMPAVMMVKLVVIFFWFRLLLTLTCRPSERPWKARKVTSFFHFLIVFSFILAFVAVIVYISIVPPSKVCGPFQNFSTPFQAFPKVTTNQLDENPAYIILLFFNTLGFKIFFTVGLVVLLLMFRRDAQQKYETMRMLRKSILMVTKDKVYYMKMLHHNTRQNPYQMIKTLPAPIHVTRSSSDASISIPPDDREHSSDGGSVDQGISSHLMASDPSPPYQPLADIVMEPEDSETQDFRDTPPLESQPEVQDPETGPDSREPEIEAFQSREPEIEAFQSREPEIEAFEIQEPETPSFDAPEPETLAFEAPAPETPAFMAPVPETPAFMAPVPETPSFDAPEPETPAFEAPAPETPALEAPKHETQPFQAREPETPPFQAPEPETPPFQAREPEQSFPMIRASGPPEDSENVYSIIDPPQHSLMRRRNVDRDPPNIEDVLASIPPPDY